ncbi:MAG: methionyl-tRNA formyltransferase [Actinomycetota bacterium]
MSRRAVFFGTPEWAVASLEAVAASAWDLAGVVTNPDRPAGRGYRLQPPPVKDRAVSLGLPVFQPASARGDDLEGWLRELAPDVAVVVAYGKILPGSLLDIPPLGFVNVHFSLLPAYRGAAPVQRAVMDGVAETGVSIMRLTEGMDEGPVLATERMTLDPARTSGEVGEELARSGARLLVRTLDAYAAGDIVPLEQDHERATYAPKITSEEAEIDWAAPATAIRRHVHGLSPFPGAWSSLGDKRFKIYRVTPVEGDNALSPGHLTVVDGDLVVGTGEGELVIEEGQLAGKRRMPGREIARGLDRGGELRLG